ncbi:MAG: CBS domain-containing protein [Chitinispirillaceae bacterium]
MNTTAPLDSSRSSLLTLEIIFKLKVRDVMSGNLVTAVKIDTMRHVQKLMREHCISGVPIAENGRLFGLISVDNILRALDFGYIEDTVEAHMTRNLIVLEDDMPLSFAISWFERYGFGRFPVLDKDEKLAGIITSRDIMSKILTELNTEVNRIESRQSAARSIVSERYYREFNVKKFDFQKGGTASNEFRKVLKQRNFDPKMVRRVAIAAYELEMNLVVHSEGGTIGCYIADDRVEIVAKDNGPGIPDVDKAMTEGYSTATDWIRSLGFGAGMGLPNVKRSADLFDIRSQTGLGTVVKATIMTDSADRVAPPAGNKEEKGSDG